MQPKEVGLPIHAYVAKEEVKPAGTEKAQRVFVHLETTVKATEVEEIGVEHLLKDVKDATISSLSTEVAGKAQVRMPRARTQRGAPPAPDHLVRERAGGAYRRSRASRCGSRRCCSTSRPSWRARCL